jgi:hypothetical protein
MFSFYVYYNLWLTMFNLFMEPFSAVKPGSFHLCPPRRQNQAEANAKQAKEEHKVLVVFGGVWWYISRR